MNPRHRFHAGAIGKGWVSALLGGVLWVLATAAGAQALVMTQETSGIALPPESHWTPTGSMNVGRVEHTATLLNNGKVLVAGGMNFDSSGQWLNSAELYDPATGTWTFTGNMLTPRANATATLLKNGKVLIADGGNKNGAVKTAELYDPATETWAATGSMNHIRGGHQATLLLDGRVLITGGDTQYQGTAELYDPNTEIWSDVSPTLITRYHQAAVLLDDGRVLIANGRAFNNANNPLGTDTNTSEIYTPSTGTGELGYWTMSGNTLIAGTHSQLILLPSRKVLWIAGTQFGITITDTMLYDIPSEVWSQGPTMNTSHERGTLIRLLDGRIVAIGGWGSAHSVEIYDPDPCASKSWLKLPSPQTERGAYHTATLLPNGTVLVAGGHGSYGGGSTASAEIFFVNPMRIINFGCFPPMPVAPLVPIDVVQ